MDKILGKSPDIHPPVTYNSSHSGPTYRADVAAALPGSSSMSMPPLNEEIPSQQDKQGRLDLEEETVTPKREQRRELPYWSNLYFQRFDAVEAKKDEREKRRDEARKEGMRREKGAKKREKGGKRQEKGKTKKTRG